MNGVVTKRILLVTLWLLPFYLPVAVWASTSGASIYILSAWKELLMAVLLLCLIKPLINLFNTPDKTTRLLNGLIAAYILLAFIYIFRASNLFDFVGGFLFDTRFLFFFLIAQALAAAARLKPEQIARITITAGTVLATIAVIQVFILSPQFLVHLGYEPYGVHLRGLPPSVTPLGSIDDFIRPQATLRGPNPLGAFLVLPLALLLWQLFKRKSSRSQNFKNGVASGGAAPVLARSHQASTKAGRIARQDPGNIGFATLFQLAIIGFAFGLTFSRSAWLAAGLATFVLFFGTFGSRLRSLKKLPIFIIAAVIILSLAAVLSTKDGRLIILRQDKNTSVNASDNQRSSLTRAALKDVQEHPLGHGLGHAGPVSALDTNDTGRIAENYYLQIGQELGWLGMALFAGITIVLLTKLWQIRRSSLAMVAFATLIGLSVANLTLHTWADEAVSIFWWSFAGAVIGTASVQNKRKKVSSK